MKDTGTNFPFKQLPKRVRACFSLFTFFVLWLLQHTWDGYINKSHVSSLSLSLSLSLSFIEDAIYWNGLFRVYYFLVFAVTAPTD